MKFIILHKRGFRAGEEEQVFINPAHVVAVENEGRALVIMIGGRHYEVTETAQEVIDKCTA